MRVKFYSEVVLLIAALFADSATYAMTLSNENSNSSKFLRHIDKMFKAPELPGQRNNRTQQRQQQANAMCPQGPNKQTMKVQIDKEAKRLMKKQKWKQG